MKKLTSLVVAASLMVGCVTPIKPDTSQRMQTAAKVAAYVGGKAYLDKNPNSRPAFELAQKELLSLSQAENLDWVTLLAVVNRLPVKELKNQEAQMIITVATITLSDYAGQLPLDRLKELQPLAGALAEGLTLALGE